MLNVSMKTLVYEVRRESWLREITCAGARENGRKTREQTLNKSYYELGKSTVNAINCFYCFMLRLNDHCYFS